ncbi:MAE_28990/MAE_18760 family HEPN-like nuclease [Ewingella sp. S1.OA.A_B6]
MENVRTTYADRVKEIDEYYQFLFFLDKGIMTGSTLLKIQNEEMSIDPILQKTLFAGVYLHLYNLVESTVTLLLKAVEKAVVNEVNNNGIGVLRNEIQSLWLRYIAGTHDSLPPEKRLEKALSICGFFLNNMPFDLEIPKGGGGNWDNENIRTLAQRMGVNLNIPRTINTSIKRPVKDGKGVIQIITLTRNKLAHGEISFSECGGELTISTAKEHIEVTKKYLLAVINCFDDYLINANYKVTL